MLPAQSLAAKRSIPFWNPRFALSGMLSSRAETVAPNPALSAEANRFAGDCASHKNGRSKQERLHQAIARDPVMRAPRQGEFIPLNWIHCDEETSRCYRE